MRRRLDHSHDDGENGCQRLANEPALPGSRGKSCLIRTTVEARRDIHIVGQQTDTSLGKPFSCILCESAPMREFIFSPVFQLPGCRGREKWMEGGESGEKRAELMTGCFKGGIRVTLPMCDPEGCSKTIHEISGLRLETVLSRLTLAASVPVGVSALHLSTSAERLTVDVGVVSPPF